MTFTIEQVLALIAALPKANPAEKPTMIAGNGRKVIVRSRDAGVQYGELEGYEGSTVYLKNARQMWSWTAAEGGTLLDCATHGVKGGKFSTVSPSVVVIGACAIIDVTDKAAVSLSAASWG